MVVVVGLAYGV